MNKCIKIKPQIISLLKFYSNSFVKSAMKTSFCHKTICLFWVPLENCTHTSRHLHYRWRSSSFYLYSALIAIDQWGFLTVPTCYNTEAVTTCFYDLGLSRLGFGHPTFRMQGERSNRLRHRGGATKRVYRTNSFKSVRMTTVIFNDRKLTTLKRFLPGKDVSQLSQFFIQNVN